MHTILSVEYMMKVIQIVPYIFLEGTPLDFYFIIVENIPKHDFRKASKNIYS